MVGLSQLRLIVFGSLPCEFLLSVALKGLKLKLVAAPTVPPEITVPVEAGLALLALVRLEASVSSLVLEQVPDSLVGFMAEVAHVRLLLGVLSQVHLEVGAGVRDVPAVHRVRLPAAALQVCECKYNKVKYKTAICELNDDYHAKQCLLTWLLK